MSRKRLYAIVAAIVVIVILFYFLKPSSQTPSALEDDDAVLGNADAPVTIVEFSDYQCPFCRKANNEAMKQVKDNYVQAGKVKVIFRDFPLDGAHPSARAAAIASECVHNQYSDEDYWKFHDKIFKEQNLLDSGEEYGPVSQTIYFTEEDIIKWASDLGYDISGCLDTRTYNSEIIKDTNDGKLAGVKGTPAFFVNGKLVSGAQPYSVFEKAIEEALRKSG